MAFAKSRNDEVGLDSAFFAESALFSAARRSLSLSLSLVAFYRKSL
ncbi:hypothetical protein [Helicobacter sp. 23-1045]